MGYCNLHCALDKAHIGDDIRVQGGNNCHPVAYEGLQRSGNHPEEMRSGFSIDRQRFEYLTHVILKHLRNITSDR